MKVRTPPINLWDSDDRGFEIARKSQIEPERCNFAQRFHEWAGALCNGAYERRNSVSVTQAVVLLTHKYFEWRAYVPNSHRNRLGSRGHVCIFQVFAEAYERLKVLELSLSPPAIFLPPIPASLPPPASTTRNIAGIFIGEEEPPDD